MNRNITFIAIALLALSGTSALLAKDAGGEKKDPKTTEVVFRANMTCDNCKRKIEKNISWEKGVKDLRIDLNKKTVTILFDPRKTNPEILEKAIEKLGFTAEIMVARPGGRFYIPGAMDSAFEE
ncbi:MAG: heavy-metal-associated domain-containing protein [Mediterranea sp.]|jgi:copper chaperone CopZ|nr:heavy-metal-associated domain-containing protein [Mediterranea sp.]